MRLDKETVIVMLMFLVGIAIVGIINTLTGEPYLV